MIVAYLASFTLLPALLKAVNPPDEPKVLGQPALAPADNFLKRHRVLVVALTAILALAGLPSLIKLQFDFNPVHLQSTHSQAVATFLQLSSDPAIDANSAQVIARSHDDAKAIANKLAALPEVDQTRTIESFIPADQSKNSRSSDMRRESLVQHWRWRLRPRPPMMRISRRFDAPRKHSTRRQVRAMAGARKWQDASLAISHSWPTRPLGIA
jgi:hypothetical protein